MPEAGFQHDVRGGSIADAGMCRRPSSYLLHVKDGEKGRVALVAAVGDLTAWAPRA